MIPLHLNRCVFTWFGLCPFDARAKLWKTYFAIGFLFVGLTIECIQLNASAKVLIASPKTDFKTLLVAFVQFSALMASIYSDLAIFYHRNQIIDTFSLIEKIYKKSEHSIWNTFKSIFDSYLLIPLAVYLWVVFRRKKRSNEMFWNSKRNWRTHNERILKIYGHWIRLFHHWNYCGEYHLLSGEIRTLRRASSISSV